jgi:UDP-N-acetylglucosamine acyltransferase
MVVLAGTTHVMEGANLGMGVTVHQNTVIGAYAMVATGAPVVKDVPPFATYIPGKPLGVNAYAVRKHGFEACAEAIEAWVLRGVVPRGTAADGLIERYQALHAASGRKQYA